MSSTVKVGALPKNVVNNFKKLDGILKNYKKTLHQVTLSTVPKKSQKKEEEFFMMKEPECEDEK